MIALLPGRSGADRAEGLILLGHPMECVEGDDEVELMPVGQAAGIGHREAEVGPVRGADAPMAFGGDAVRTSSGLIVGPRSRRCTHLPKEAPRYNLTS